MKKKKKSKSKGLYRDGNKLVIREGARFPARCALCNKPCEGDVVEFEFGRDDKSNYIEVAAVQSIARGVGDLVTGSRYTGPVAAEVPMCGWHSNKRLRQIGVGLGATALGVGYVFLRYSLYGGGEFDLFQMSMFTVFAIIAAVIGLIAAIAALGNRTRVWFRATKYYDRFVWVVGAGRAYLGELPDVEPHHYKLDAGEPDGTGGGPHLSADELIRRGG